MRKLLPNRWLQVALVISLAILASVGFYYWQLSNPPKATNIEFILDASGSMGAPLATDLSSLLTGAETKISAAKRILIGKVQEFPNSTRAGLRVFRDCGDRRLRVPIGELDSQRKQDIERVVQFEDPSGGTPIADSLLDAGMDFPAGVEQENIIVLITDGYETCGNLDPCAVANQLRASDARPTIHVIGVGTSEDLDEKFRCIAGDPENFTPVRDPATFERAIGNIGACSCSWRPELLAFLVFASVGLLALWPWFRFARE